jgi:AcrR family transcriptional regulator
MKGKSTAIARSTTKRSGATRSRRAVPRHSKESVPTVELILESARVVLVTRGYAAFTARRVAEAAGIAVGNLTYHFPSKRDLLRALIARLLQSYARRFETYLKDSNRSPALDLEALVRWVWTDAIDVDTARTFRELWALALHDVVIRRAIDDFYDDAMGGVVQLLQQARPHADVQTIRLLIQLATMVAEGGSVLYGTRRVRAVPHARILELVPRLIDLVAPELRIAADKSGRVGA